MVSGSPVVTGLNRRLTSRDVLRQTQRLGRINVDAKHIKEYRPTREACDVKKALTTLWPGEATP